MSRNCIERKFRRSKWDKYEMSKGRNEEVNQPDIKEVTSEQLQNCTKKLEISEWCILVESTLKISFLALRKKRVFILLHTKFVGYIGINEKGNTLSVFLSVRPSVRMSVQSKLNLHHNFLTKGDRALILHKCITCDNTFLSIPKKAFVDFMTLTLTFDLLIGKIKIIIGNNFWTKRDRAFIFHMCISCGKTFLLETKVFTSWPWPWILTYFSKNLTLTITFEQIVIGL